MHDSPEHIIDILKDGDESSAVPLLKRLRDNHQLLENVCDLARQLEIHIESLSNLALEVQAPQLILHFRNTDDLEEGLWLLPKLEDPYIDYAQAGRQALNAFAQRFDEHHDAGKIAHALGEDWGFGGNRQNYHQPENCLLNHCIERRIGMPITLVSLWILICRRLRLNAQAVAPPGHVYGAWDGGYLDCFSGGTAIEENTLHDFARRQGQSDASPYLTGATDQQLLQRFALNLAVSYRQHGDLLRTLIATSMAAGSNHGKSPE